MWIHSGTAAHMTARCLPAQMMAIQPCRTPAGLASGGSRSTTLFLSRRQVSGALTCLAKGTKLVRMSSTGAGYDLSPTTFSPDGRLFQVEYAGKAVENSGTAIGLKCKDGVLLAVENIVTSKLLVPKSSRRIFTVADHAGIAVAGLLADGRQIVNRARDEAESYKENFGTPIPPSVLADRLAQFVHYFTLHGSLRPFGASALVVGHDDFKDSHELYMIEPSGTFFKYFGTAVGKGRQGAKTEIEKLKLTETSVNDAVKEVTKILHKLHDESKDKPFELELAWATQANGWKFKHVPKETIAEAEAWAKAAIEAEDMDEDES